jgi:hypothetical protein
LTVDRYGDVNLYTWGIYTDSVYNEDTDEDEDVDHECFLDECEECVGGNPGDPSDWGITGVLPIDFAANSAIVDESLVRLGARRQSIRGTIRLP